MVVSLREPQSKPIDSSEKQIIEWLKCKKSFLYFLRTYVYLADRAKEQTVKFEPWPHLLKLADDFAKNKYIIILKARQLGVSWFVCAYCLWKAKFSENVKILFLSQGEEEAFDLISKCRFIDNNLPEWMKTKRVPDQAGYFGLPDCSSELKALPSTEKAGRSTDATIVVCDEWEFHPYAEQNFASLKPTVDAGGQFIGLSTADKTKLNTFFKQKYHEAMQGIGRFKNIFIGWRERPGRDDTWFKNATSDLRDWQREGEYPETEDDALGVLRTRKYFDAEALARMPKIELIKCEVSDKWKGIVRVYKLPVPGRRYAVFTDPSDGKEDPHATIVRDHQTGEWVAVSHGMLPAGDNAVIHDELVRFYNNAFNSYELNSRAGGIFSERITQLATPSQCPFIDTSGKLNEKGKKGWWTGKAAKDKMRMLLEEAIRLRMDTIYDASCIKELSVYIQPEGEEPQAPQGAHDDYVMAGGGVIAIDHYMPAVNKGVVRSTPYREVW